VTDRITAPWTTEQVAALNRFQREGRLHPFTCGNEHPGHHGTLIASGKGWYCPVTGCDYEQNWAHDFMADAESWPKSFLPPPRPATSADGADNGLRRQIAAALTRHQREHERSMYCECGAWVDDMEAHRAAAVRAVRDRRMEQLTAKTAAANERARATEADNAQLRQRLDNIIKHRDQVETALAMQKGISADLRVESRARGEKLAKAEAAIARVIDLAGQWTTAGPPAIGALINRWWDQRLAELWATITEPALDGPAATTPPDPLAQLRVWLSTEAAICRRNADAASIEEAAQALGGMAAGCETAVWVIDGMAAGRGLPVSGGVKPEAGAGG
jgi:hypothetical protein